jgi:hypothetical protein
VTVTGNKTRLVNIVGRLRLALILARVGFKQGWEGYDKPEYWCSSGDGCTEPWDERAEQEQNKFAAKQTGHVAACTLPAPQRPDSAITGHVTTK